MLFYSVFFSEEDFAVVLKPDGSCTLLNMTSVTARTFHSPSGDDITYVCYLIITFFMMMMMMIISIVIVIFILIIIIQFKGCEEPQQYRAAEWSPR